MGGVDGDVAAGVAGTDDQHPLAGEDVGVAVAAGVHDLAVEGPLERRHRRLAQRAVAQQHRRVALGAGAVGAGAGHQPLLARWIRVRLHRGHLGAEADLLAQAEGVGEVAEVAVQLAVAGVVGHLLAHRELGVRRGGLGGDEVGRLVHRAARPVDVPQPADVVGQLVADRRDAVALQGAQGGQPGGAGADHGAGEVLVVGQVSHGRLLRWRSSGGSSGARRARARGVARARRRGRCGPPAPAAGASARPRARPGRRRRR